MNQYPQTLLMPFVKYFTAQFRILLNSSLNKNCHDYKCDFGSFLLPSINDATHIRINFNRITMDNLYLLHFYFHNSKKGRILLPLDPSFLCCHISFNAVECKLLVKLTKSFTLYSVSFPLLSCC